MYNSCISCTDVSCQVGSYRQYCEKGSPSLPSCVSCNPLQGQFKGGCSAGSYTRSCNGLGYGTTGERSKQCEVCRTETSMACDPSAPFEKCKTYESSDTSQCKLCPQLNNTDVQAEGILNYTGTCVFDCKVGYYRQRETNSDDKEVYSCVLCPTDVNEACHACIKPKSCKGYGVDECLQPGLEKPPKCHCQPGFSYWGHQEGDRAECVECTSFTTSPGGEVVCTHCVGGYSGATERGSTSCQACPVDTYRPALNNFGNLNDAGCLPCAAGTHGITGATSCISCPNGMMAKLVVWEGLLFNYHNRTWFYWSGVPPTQCAVRGMAPDMQICDTTQSRDDIRWVESRQSTSEWNVGDVNVEFECSFCTGGLAFSSNFEYSIAVVSELL